MSYTLDTKEPIYEFDFETKFIPLLEKYPRDQPPFNWLDNKLKLIYIIALR